MSKNEEIAGFLRQRMVAEMKRFHEFADNMNGRAYYGGSIFVQFKDGTTDEYLLRPEDWQDIIEGGDNQGGNQGGGTTGGELEG